MRLVFFGVEKISLLYLSHIMSVALFVEAKQTRDGAGIPIPPAAGTVPTADGAGGATWVPALLASGSVPMTAPLILNTGAVAGGNAYAMLPGSATNVGTSTAAEVSMLNGTTAKGSLTIPANAYVPGSKLRFTAYVVDVANAAGAAYTFRLRLNGGLAWQSTYNPASLADVSINVDVVVQNSLNQYVESRLTANGVAPVIAQTTGVTGWNTAATAAIGFSVQANTADPGNTVRLLRFDVDSFP